MNLECQQLKQDFSLLKIEFENFVLVLNNISSTEDINTAKELQTKIRSELESLHDESYPHRLTLRIKLAQKLEANFVSTFKEGRARAEKDGKSFYINVEGKRITRSFSYADEFSDGIAVVNEYGGKYYYINLEGRKVAFGDNFDYEITN